MNGYVGRHRAPVLPGTVPIGPRLSLPCLRLPTSRRGKIAATALGAAVAMLAGGGVVHATTDASTATSCPVSVSATGVASMPACQLPVPAPVTVTVPGPTVTATVTTSVTASSSPSGSSSAPVPSPTPTSSSPAPSGGFPGPESTGVSGALQQVPGQVASGPGWAWDARGWVTITGANTTFSGYSVAGAVEIYAPGVTVTNNEIINSGSGWAIGLRPGVRGTVIDHNSIHGQDAGAGRLVYGIFNVNGNDPALQVTGNDIYWTAHGIQVEQGLVADNWVHSMGFIVGDHTECIFSGGGGSGQLTIRHNTLINERDQVAAIILSTTFGAQRNRLIDNNLLTGGGYTLYGGHVANPASTNIDVTNNEFSTQIWPKGGYYGSPVVNFSLNDPGNSWSGNTWADGPNAGQPVPSS